MRSIHVVLAAVFHVMIIRLRGVNGFIAHSMKRAHDGRAAQAGSTAASTRIYVGGAATAPITTNTTSSSAKAEVSTAPPSSPLYLAEGLLAVHKPLTWTSSDVVSYVRGVLDRDAKDRLGPQAQQQRGRRKKPMMKVGHGGTLDPLASGVLVLGVGKGTTLLQSYLEGDKQYTASCELGYETDTLDAEGKLVKEAAWDHVDGIPAVEEAIVPKFTGKIQQVPPLYSAIRVDGKKLYEIARKDSSKAEDVEIPKRDVEIYELKVGSELDESVIKSGVVNGPKYRKEAKVLEEAAALKAAAEAEAAANNQDNGTANKEESSDDEGGKSKKKRRRRNNKKRGNNNNSKKNLFDEQTVPAIQPTESSVQLPQFTLSVSCGGGTYIRSLVRDIGYELNTVATMTGLVRTKQGPFVLGDALRKEDWTAENIYEAIRKSKERQIGL